MGHGYPKIIAAAYKAMEEGAVVNLPFHSPYYGKLAKRLHEVDALFLFKVARVDKFLLFGYDKFVALTSGGEAADPAVKIARKWGYMTKRIPDGECHILTAAACYHGVTISTTSLASKKNHLFGPFVPNVGATSPSGKLIRFGELEDLREALEIDGSKIAAFMVEPIQGSAGIVAPSTGYLKQVAALCKKYNVLFIADEVQTGLGRTGANLSHLREGVRPDLVVLGKALAGGMYPLSGVMGDNNTFGLLEPFEIGSTMAANPIGCAAALAAVNVLVDENLSARANEMGDILISILKAANLPRVSEYMGSGLFWSIVLDEEPPKITPRRIVSLLAQRGVLASAAGVRRIRICPPLTISKEELLKGAEIVIGAMKDIENAGWLPAETLD